jgi:hypothetical protein
MPAAIRFPPVTLALGLALAVGLAGAAPARADDNMLRGPHPFLRENELSAHVLLAEGLADSPTGTKLAFDYGYKLAVPLWLDLQLNLQLSTCHSTPGAPTCGPATGKAVETLAGVKWKWPTAIPVVPYAKAGAGLAFVFPSGANSAIALMARAAGGANYFFFDWLGLGAEIGFSVGHAFYDATFPGSHTYAVLDFGGGIEFQF